MPKLDPEVQAHLEWLGFVRPTGLVVSAPALVRAGAILDRRDIEGQRLLRDCVAERAFGRPEAAVPHLTDFRAFAESVLGWSFSPSGYSGTAACPIPAELEVPLPDYGEVLRPDYAVRELAPKDGAAAWQLLVRVLEVGEDFDEVVRAERGLEASPHSRMERLLRQTAVPAGLLVNGRALRLLSAPRGESSGWLDFSIADMVETAGRPILSALRLLLGEARLLSLPRAQRLAALLEESRRFQNEVSERLAEQVLHALYELLRGFQAAHDASKGALLREVLSEHPDEVYRALLTCILRLVFLLYAEERDMLPQQGPFLRSYSLAGLYERLREDAALYPDTLDQRFGAWAQLLVLFRLVYDGAEADGMRLPARHGALFDPDRFPFLEGRPLSGARQVHERIEPPLVPDGAVYRALEKLLVLDGERISYRALDVEEIGSVYETMMGFRLETAAGRSVAIRAPKRRGAPAVVDLEALLREPAAKRDKWLQERGDRRVPDAVGKAAGAATVEDLHAALQPLVDLAASPDLVPMGAMVLQPTPERRRSGSYYTPRSLTEPIVRTALEPILARIRTDGQPPAAAAILELKVCDPAMGSGAFLVEACRQLGEALIESWHAHGDVPPIPPDEDEHTFARRLVAQRCLYGVDRNPVAVDLAKMSLWLATLARDHALTFVDHALRHGDSLVGLSRQQLESFHWAAGAPLFQAGLETMRVREHVAATAELRRRIREAGDDVSDWERRDLWDQAEAEFEKVRLFGDLVVAAYFDAAGPKGREVKRSEYAGAVLSGDAERYRDWLEERRHAVPPLAPFHWEIEFPEVFERANPGFDAFVGNPPFGGKNTVAASNIVWYPDWLQVVHAETHGNSDLVAHFFRRTFDLTRRGGTIGLIATNTVAQGDTRASGLRWICQHGGDIYAVRKRVKWPLPGPAVTVSVVHACKGAHQTSHLLDERAVDRITAYLFHTGGDDDPQLLTANQGKAFVGSYVLGMGFLFDDHDNTGVASSLSEMHSLIAQDPRNRELIFPYVSGEELNSSPSQQTNRYVINFGTMSETDARGWPDLMAIVESKERAKRQTRGSIVNPDRWWMFARPAAELYTAMRPLSRVLATSSVSKHRAFVFMPTSVCVSHNVTVVALATDSAFAIVQSDLHAVWATFFSSSLEDRSGYRPSDCFETFPFPPDWESDRVLEATGKAYYDFRAALMVRNNEGLTKTYNRFHDPEERDPEILTLRDLHAAMDRAVLDAYGWTDIPTECEFLLDYEIDEEEWGERKKPYRYRWPDKIRDEVLARLLELNAERAKGEARAGAAAATKPAGKRAAAKRAPTESGMGRLFS